MEINLIRSCTFVDDRGVEYKDNWGSYLGKVLLTWACLQLRILNTHGKARWQNLHFLSELFRTASNKCVKAWERAYIQSQYGYNNLCEFLSLCMKHKSIKGEVWGHVLQENILNLRASRVCSEAILGHYCLLTTPHLTFDSMCVCSVSPLEVINTWTTAVADWWGWRHFGPTLWSLILTFCNINFTRAYSDELRHGTSHFYTRYTDTSKINRKSRRPDNLICVYMKP